MWLTLATGWRQKLLLVFNQLVYLRVFATIGFLFSIKVLKNRDRGCF